MKDGSDDTVNTIVDGMLREKGLDPKLYRDLLLWVLAGQHGGKVSIPDRAWFQKWAAQQRKQHDKLKDEQIRRLG